MIGYAFKHAAACACESPRGLQHVTSQRNRRARQVAKPAHGTESSTEQSNAANWIKRRRMSVGAIPTSPTVRLPKISDEALRMLDYPYWRRRRKASQTKRKDAWRAGQTAILETN